MNKFAQFNFAFVLTILGIIAFSCLKEILKIEREIDSMRISKDQIGLSKIEICNDANLIGRTQVPIIGNFENKLIKANESYF